jgi:hypothetical protein
MLRKLILGNSSRFVRSRFFSATPEPLSVQEIENRVLDTLKSFSKVDQSKVFFMTIIFRLN